MLPIFALAETQSWRRDDYSVSLRCESEHVINAFLATVDRDMTLPANSAEDAWFDAATVGLDGVKRDWGPSWTVAREIWPLLAERLGVRLSFRQLHCDKGRPDLAALLLAELSGNWSATGYWMFGPKDSVQFTVHRSGMLVIECGDAHVDELCAHTGLAIEAPTGSSRIMHVDPATTLGLFERLSAWSPHTLAWLSAAI